MSQPESPSVYANVQAAYDLLDIYRTETAAGYLETLRIGFIEPVLNDPNLALKLYFDGVGASGKGTILALLEELGIETTSTGIFARAITKYAVDHGYTVWNSPEEQQQKCEELKAKIPDLTITLEKTKTGWVAVIIEITRRRYKKENVTREYRYAQSDLSAATVTENISYVAGLDFVCDMLDETIIALSRKFPKIAIDGRDNWARAERNAEMSTVTQFYFYVFAALEDRQNRAAERRENHLKASRSEITPEELEAELAVVREMIALRDERDMAREHGRLLRPEEAKTMKIYNWFFDTTLLNIEEMQIFFLAKLYALLLPDQGHAFFEALEVYFQQREEDRQAMLALDIEARRVYEEERRDAVRQLQTLAGLVRTPEMAMAT